MNKGEVLQRVEELRNKIGDTELLNRLLSVAPAENLLYLIDEAVDTENHKI